MGHYRPRRPFVWQDEMAEVRNLFQKVAKVRDSGFTGFSLGKDEPTAETLSRNRLRRRRCQYALELTHLNYGESPYEALNHLHNIRGMCSRIQRQDRYVERKKKDYDSELQPALLRRPVTASYSKPASDKASLRSSRPGSAPIMAGTPLYFTPSKPTTLYDATHRCPRSKEITHQSSILNFNKTHDRRIRTGLKALAKTSSSETTPVASTRCSSSVSPSSIASSAKTNLKASRNGCLSTLTVDSSPKLDGSSTTMTRMRLQNAYAKGETVSDDENTAASASYSEAESPKASVFSSSRVPVVNGVERPPSRMMSKRPSADTTKAMLAEKREKRGGNVPRRQDDRAPPRESAGHELNGSNFGSSARHGIDAVTTQSGRPASTGTLESRMLFEEQVCKFNRPSSGPWKEKYPLSSSDGNSGLWALRQEQQRPVSAGAKMSRANSTTAPSSDETHLRPGTSSTQVGDQIFPREERVTRFSSSPSANKMSGKEQLKVRAPSGTLDQELETVVRSGYRSQETHDTSIRSEHGDLKSPGVTLDHSYQQRPNQSDSLRDENFKEASSAGANEPPTTTASGSGESHVMIRHSTDPYTDFKYSMLRMIDEENLYDKQWELEELFQYYMDLNPAVHHEVLQMVMSDIRKNIATYKAHRCYPDST